MSGFFNNFAPGNLGGDTVRFIALFRQGNSGFTVTSSIIFERIYNFTLLSALCIWALLAQPLPLTIPVNERVGWWLVTVGAAALTLWFCLRHHVPKNIKEYVVQATLMAGRVLRHPSEFGWAILGTFLLNFTLMLITLCNSQAVSIHLSLSVHLAAYAIAGMAVAFPITIQGIGIREGIYMSLFGSIGIAPEKVIAALALNYVVLVFFSVLGGFLFLSYAGRMRSQAR
jgi:hypothetical protein